MYDLSGKIALVTGASRGIGRSIAHQLALRGAQVIINYARNEEEAQKTAEFIKDSCALSPVLKKFNVADPKLTNEAIAEIVEAVGSIDILVNNAGISKDGLILRFKDEDWNEVINTNLTGAFNCSRACARSMIKKRFGRIINISSVVGESGNAGQSAYVAAKSGMIGLTKTLALELGSRGVTVNAVSPGYIQTDMTASLDDKLKAALIDKIPLGYVGDPIDIANAVVYLASDEARYVTGHVLSVNGGLYT